MLTQGTLPDHHTSSPQSAHLEFHSYGQSDRRGKRQPTHIKNRTMQHDYSLDNRYTIIIVDGKIQCAPT